MTKQFVLISWLAATSSLLAEPAHRDDPAFQLLVETRAFRGAAIGPMGVCSSEVQAVRGLLARTDAKAAFRDLWERAGVVGKLYALCGLWFKDPEYFAECVNVLERSEELIEDQRFGCIVGESKVGDVVRSDDPFTIRLDYPGQTVREWIEKHGFDEEGVQFLSEDIAGGGFPSWFGLPAEEPSVAEREREFARHVASLEDSENEDFFTAAEALLFRFGADGLKVIDRLLKEGDDAARVSLLGLLADGDAAPPAALLPTVLAIAQAEMSVEPRRPPAEDAEDDEEDGDPAEESYEQEREAVYFAASALARFEDSASISCEAVEGLVRDSLAHTRSDGTPDDALSVHLYLTRRCEDLAQRLTLELLRTDSPEIREETVSHLLDQGKNSPPWAIRGLVRCLGEPDAVVQLAALESLARCGTKARALLSLAQLKELIAEARPYERALVGLAAWRIFGHEGLFEENVVAQPRVWRRLFDREQREDLRSYVAARPATLEQLSAMIGEPVHGSEGRAQILDLVAELGPQARAAAPSLRRALESGDRGLPTRSVARTLWKVSGDAGPYVELVRAQLTSEERSWIITRELHGVWELGPAAAPLVPELGRWLRTSSVQTQERVIGILGAIGEGAASELPQILPLLGTNDFAPRVVVRIDPTLEQSAPAIKDFLATAPLYLRARVLCALADCAPEHAREVLEASREDPSPTLRWVVGQLLARR